MTYPEGRIETGGGVTRHASTYEISGVYMDFISPALDIWGIRYNNSDIVQIQHQELTLEDAKKHLQDIIDWIDNRSTYPTEED